MKNRVADYIVTGQWAKKAWQEARSMERQIRSPLLKIRPIPIYRTVQIFLSVLTQITYISVRTIPFTAQSSKSFQTPREKTLVADVSSCFLSEPVDVSKYGILYGGGPEEYRSCGNGHFHYPGGSDHRGCPSRNPYHADL